MKNVALLMELDIKLHGKRIWRMKWQFLLFALIFAAVILSALRQQPKLFHITYYNEDSSYGSRLAISNFITALKEVAEIEEVRDPLQGNRGDAFVYFPAGFAEKWQHFEKFPVQITILTQNPVYRALLEESFQAYENIMLASESVIRVFNDELDVLGLSPEEWTGANIKISLDFISMAFNRNQFYETVTWKDLPATLTKSYYFYGFSLFFGLLFAIYWNSAEIDRRKQYCRIFLSRITKTEYFLASLLLTAGFILLYLLILWGLSAALDIRPNAGYFFGFYMVLLAVSLLLRLITFRFEREESYSVISVAVLFLFALLGGLFLPVSFLPPDWVGILYYTPFYRIFLFLSRQAVAGDQIWTAVGWLVAVLLLIPANWEMVRRAKYV